MGKTEEEATRNIREAIEGVLSVLNARARPTGAQQILDVGV